MALQYDLKDYFLSLMVYHVFMPYYLVGFRQRGFGVNWDQFSYSRRAVKSSQACTFCGVVNLVIW